jgi:colicin import membrane protein
MKPYLPLLLLTLMSVVQAEEPLSDDEKNRLLDQARGLKEQANAMHEAARNRYKEEEAACWKKYLVSSCIDDAKQQHRQESRKANELEHQAREIERDVRKRDFAQREAKRIEDAPRKEAEAAAKAAKNKADQEEAQRRMEARQKGAAAK